MILFLASYFSNPETYSNIITYLDEKKLIAKTFSASTASVSTTITMLPSDYGNSIAGVIANISSKFIIVLGAIDYIVAVFSYLVSSVNNTINYAGDYIKSIPERLKNALNNVLDATAVVSYNLCSTNIGVMFAFVVVFNTIFSLNIDMKRNFNTLNLNIKKSIFERK